MLRLEPPNDDTTIEQVAGVIDESRASGAEEERVVSVADCDRVDDDAGDEVPAQLPQVQLPAAHARRDLVLDHRPQRVAPVRRARDPDDQAENDQGDDDEHEGADQRNEAATFH
jgi:hypothetical protein